MLASIAEREQFRMKFKFDFEIMIEIQNSQECFVMLWRKLERTRRLLGGQCKRFCIRNVMKSWFDFEANDDFIWRVCHLCEQEGWNELPEPLDAAYSIAFPNSTPINVNKKSKRVKK